MLFFCCTAIVCFHRDAYLLKQHDILLFPRTPFELKMVTPLFSGGTFPARCWKLCQRCPVRCNTALE
jgi:hypothetical protein